MSRPAPLQDSEFIGGVHRLKSLIAEGSNLVGGNIKILDRIEYFLDYNECGVAFSVVLSQSPKFISRCSDESLQLCILLLENLKPMFNEPDPDEDWTANTLNAALNFIREARRRGLFVPTDLGWPD